MKALQIVAGQVSRCARFLPSRTFHMFNWHRSWRRLPTHSSMWGLFSEDRSHNICAWLHSFTAKTMQTLDQLAGRKHIINAESLVCCFSGHLLHATQSKNIRLSIHCVCNKGRILSTFYQYNVQLNSVHNSIMFLMHGNALQAFGWNCLLALRVHDSINCTYVIMRVYLYIHYTYVYLSACVCIDCFLQQQERETPLRGCVWHPIARSPALSRSNKLSKFLQWSMALHLRVHRSEMLWEDDVTQTTRI